MCYDISAATHSKLPNSSSRSTSRPSTGSPSCGYPTKIPSAYYLLNCGDVWVLHGRHGCTFIGHGCSVAGHGQLVDARLGRPIANPAGNLSCLAASASSHAFRESSNECLFFVIFLVRLLCLCIDSSSRSLLAD